MSSSTQAPAVKTRPILFSSEMVRAILDGRKSQTRRVAKFPVHPAIVDWVLDADFNAVARAASEAVLDQYITSFPHERRRCPYGVVGDRLYVKEKWIEGFQVDTRGKEWSCIRPSDFRDTHGNAFYFADAHDPGDCPQRSWRSPRFMPRWASRLTLEITGVRVERLQSISEADVRAEGVQFHVDAKTGCPLIQVSGKHAPCNYYRDGDPPVQFIRAHFASLWDSINGKTFPWESNPWVWVVGFRVAASLAPSAPGKGGERA